MGPTTLYLHATGLWHVWSSITSSRSNSCISDITTTTTFCRIHFFLQIFAIYWKFLWVPKYTMLPLLVKYYCCHRQDVMTMWPWQYCNIGMLQFNSFVLTAIFPVLRCILETPVLYDESCHHDSRFSCRCSEDYWSPWIKSTWKSHVEDNLFMEL